MEAVRSFLTTSLKLVLENIYQAAVLLWTKGRLLKGKKLIYGVWKKKSQGGMILKKMGVCRYGEVVRFEIASLHWHNWW